MNNERPTTPEEGSRHYSDEHLQRVQKLHGWIKTMFRKTMRLITGKKKYKETRVLSFVELEQQRVEKARKCAEKARKSAMRPFNQKVMEFIIAEEPSELRNLLQLQRKPVLLHVALVMGTLTITAFDLRDVQRSMEVEVHHQDITDSTIEYWVAYHNSHSAETWRVVPYHDNHDRFTPVFVYRRSLTVEQMLKHFSVVTYHEILADRYRTPPEENHADPE